MGKTPFWVRVAGKRTCAVTIWFFASCLALEAPASEASVSDISDFEEEPEVPPFLGLRFRV